MSPQHGFESGPILFPVCLQMLNSPLWAMYKKAAPASLLQKHLTIICLVSIKNRIVSRTKMEPGDDST